MCIGSDFQSYCPDKVINYEKLKNLPCFLILVDKGRMGDTFPKTFSVLDMRTRPCIGAYSTMAQELGRLCRYTKKDESLPYCILSAQFHKQICDQKLLINATKKTDA
jgi:hypothetical protein